MEYLASTANEPLRVVTGSVRTVRSETCSRICKLRIELDPIDTVEAGTRWKHRESACLGSMDLASGQSRGLLRFLPSKLSPRGVASLVHGAFTAATAKALSIPSWLRRLSFLLSPSLSLLLLLRLLLLFGFRFSSSFRHRHDGALVFLNAQQLILLDRTRPRCVKRDVVARNYFMPRSSFLFVVIRMIAWLACA